MKEAFEKIVERLEEPQFNIGCGACPIKEKCDEVQEAIDDEMTDLCAETMRVIAKEIVKEVAEEYDNGWIPCSERLPDKAGYEVLATLENGYGQRRVTIIFTGYGDSQWQCNHKEFDLDVWKVIAWQPLPEPYKEND